MNPIVEKSPLRRWRKENRYTMPDIALKLGVSSKTIDSWEKGATMPRDYFAKIGALIGLSESKLRKLWTKWKHAAAQSTAGTITATAEEAMRARIAHGAALKAWETRRAMAAAKTTPSAS